MIVQHSGLDPGLVYVACSGCGGLALMLAGSDHRTQCAACRPVDFDARTGLRGS
jgi:hypothetical protein